MRFRRAAFFSNFVFLLIVVTLFYPLSSQAQAAEKSNSVFYPSQLRAIAKANADNPNYPDSNQIDAIVEKANYWKDMDPNVLWSLVFGATLERSAEVWSDGYCPYDHYPVPMYNWDINVVDHPWKVQCPNCHRFFPTNDFSAYYHSGIDCNTGIFDANRADANYLVNLTDINGTSWGVDGGNGFVDSNDSNHCWRFIGYYLIRGQWDGLVLGGIRNLAAAYIFTDDANYALTAGILLDRVADVFSDFNYATQGYIYGKKLQSDISYQGYVTPCYDSSEEVRLLALAYDQVYEGMWEKREQLVAFLSSKQNEYPLIGDKSSFDSIKKNIEDKLFGCILEPKNAIKIGHGSLGGSYDYSEQQAVQARMSEMIIKTVLGNDVNEYINDIWQLVDDITKIDGLLGTKSLAGYAMATPQSLAKFLGEYMRQDPNFLLNIGVLHKEHLRQAYRFYADTWCLGGKYYPLSGDSFWNIAVPFYFYGGVDLMRSGDYDSLLSYPMHSFMWELYKITGDKVFAQVTYVTNKNIAEKFELNGFWTYDVFAATNDCNTAREGIESEVNAVGTEFEVGSVDKEEWHIAVMRSGQGDNARAFWLDYDSGGPHGHADGMNLGLFAKGRDMLPDFGYTLSQFGGWATTEANWYYSTAAHNTVVIDGKSTGKKPADINSIVSGQTTVWAEGERFQGVRVSGPNIINVIPDGERYERTVIMNDISGNDFYLVDVFRVKGGREHAKFLTSHFVDVNGEIDTGDTLSLDPFSSQYHPDDPYWDPHDTNDPNGPYDPNDVNINPYNYDPCGYVRGTYLRNFRGNQNPRSPAEGGWWVDLNIEDSYDWAWDYYGSYKILRDSPNDVHLRYYDLTEKAAGYICEAWVMPTFTQNCWLPRIVTFRTGDRPLESTFVSVLEPYEGTSNIEFIRRLALNRQDGLPYPDPNSNVAVEIKLKNGDSDLIILADPNSYADNGLLVVNNDGWNVNADASICLVRKDISGKLRRVVGAKGVSESGNCSITVEGEEIPRGCISFGFGNLIFFEYNALENEPNLLIGRWSGFSEPLKLSTLNRKRVGRTEFQYECKMTLKNSCDEPIQNVEVEILEVPSNMTIVDPYLTFNRIEPGSEADSNDSCIVIVDRPKQIVWSEILWRVTYELVNTGDKIKQTFPATVLLDSSDIKGDITGDGVVDFEDLTKMAEQWLGPPGTPSADIAPLPGGDGIVDFLDFARLAMGWMQ